MVDFVSLIFGAKLLEGATGFNVFAVAREGWLDRVRDLLETFRRADGGYAKTDQGQSSSTYYSFLVALCQQLLGIPTPEPERLIAFALSRQRDDGGFVETGPMRRSGANPTAAAIGLLRALGSLEGDAREGAIGFLADMQTDEGGLRANTRIPIADLLSTFTGLVSLADLDALGEVNLKEAERFVRRLAREEGGFHAAEWDPGHDVEYTFYGLGAMALLAGAEHWSSGAGAPRA